jgi:hypothetical protein
MVCGKRGVAFSYGPCALLYPARRLSSNINFIIMMIGLLYFPMKEKLNRYRDIALYPLGMSSTLPDS